MRPVVGTAALERWFVSGRRFEQPLVPNAIRRPRLSVEAFQTDRAAVDEALSIRSVVDSLQRILHLLQNCGIELGFGEIFAFGLIGHARIPCIGCCVDQLLASRCHVTCFAT